MVLALSLLAAPAALLYAASGPTAPDPEPSPDLLPEEVVRIQVEALQRNDEPSPDAGIAAAFRFASPGNRAATGPLDRFARMVKGPVYRDMLGFARADYEPMRVEGRRAVQRVTLTHADGRRVAYVFELSQQRGGDCDGCWMTDSVIREAQPPEPALRRI
ncbi:MAG: DUF4864 domain-containing protein [Bacteroidota bacterium]